MTWKAHATICLWLMNEARNIKTRSLFTSLTIALLGQVLLACGGVGMRIHSGASTGLVKDWDHDGDFDNVHVHDNDLYFGHSATPTARQTVTAVLERYYAAAAADDGVRACLLLYAPLADEIPIVYGRSPPGPPELRGKTCSMVMTKLFKQHRPRLVVDSATLDMTGLLVEGERGLALLRFRTMGNRHMFVQREHGIWKVNELLDAGPPQ